MNRITTEPCEYLARDIDYLLLSLPKDAIQCILKDSIFTLDFNSIKDLDSINSLFSILKFIIASNNKLAESTSYRDYKKLLSFVDSKVNNMDKSIHYSTELFLWMGMVENTIKTKDRILEEITIYNNKLATL